MCYIFRQRKTSRLYILGSTKNIMVLATILSFATYGRQPIHLPRAVRLIAYYRSWLSGQYASDLLNPTRTFLSFSLQLREYGKLQSANSAALSQFILHDLLCSSMSAEPPSKSTHLLPQLNKRPERQWSLPLTRQSPQTFLYGQSGIRRCRLQCWHSPQATNDITSSDILW